MLGRGERRTAGLRLPESTQLYALHWGGTLKSWYLAFLAALATRSFWVKLLFCWQALAEHSECFRPAFRGYQIFCRLLYLSRVVRFIIGDHMNDFQRTLDHPMFEMPGCNLYPTCAHRWRVTSGLRAHDDQDGQDGHDGHEFWWESKEPFAPWHRHGFDGPFEVPRLRTTKSSALCPRVAPRFGECHDSDVHCRAWSIFGTSESGSWHFVFEALKMLSCFFS